MIKSTKTLYILVYNHVWKLSAEDNFTDYGVLQHYKIKYMKDVMSEDQSF